MKKVKNYKFKKFYERILLSYIKMDQYIYIKYKYIKFHQYKRPFKRF